ncbi:hypothetical protein GIB67_020086 [Kingdonia uniflora]|uniref:Uncharacterized protein n=1 Tax=Kingdonia uniflora TaxID=39325 RepID=A0A7J7L2J2_9MAGN|nr:hypothetical protein GIB67_020086 [Kingdonia uniflora]
MPHKEIGALGGTEAYTNFRDNLCANMWLEYVNSGHYHPAQVIYFVLYLFICLLYSFIAVFVMTMMRDHFNKFVWYVSCLVIFMTSIIVWYIIYL